MRKHGTCLVCFRSLRSTMITDEFAAMVLLHRQDVGFHRYIMRQSARMPNSAHLTIMSANNSLVSGTYHHALGKYIFILLCLIRSPPAEYLSARQVSAEDMKDDAYLLLAIGVTFVHLASKKDVLRRHDVCLHVSGGLHAYCNIRECSSAGSGISTTI